MSDWQQVTELSVAHLGQTIKVEIRAESLRYGIKTSEVWVTGPLEQLTCRAYAGGTPNVVDIRIGGLPMELAVSTQNRFRVV